MKPVAQHADATLEMEEAASWYEQREFGLGERFLHAVNQAKRFIRQNPEVGTPHRRGTRKWRVRGFPYVLIYRDEPDCVLVVSVAHGSRRPGYWRDRVN